jgi:hypothetical protein
MPASPTPRMAMRPAISSVRAAFTKYPSASWPFCAGCVISCA